MGRRFLSLLESGKDLVLSEEKEQEHPRGLGAGILSDAPGASLPNPPTPHRRRSRCAPMYMRSMPQTRTRASMGPCATAS